MEINKNKMIIKYPKIYVRMQEMINWSENVPKRAKIRVCGSDIIG